MAKKRVTRKQLLKEPDEFITFTGKIIQFAKMYQTYLLYGAGALLLLILIVGGTRYYFGWKEKRAAVSLGQAVFRYEKITSENGDIAEVKSDFKEIVAKYSGYDGGKLARVMYANICFASGDFDTAILHYTQAIEEFNDNPSIQAFIRNSIGLAYQAKKDYQAAANHFEKIISEPHASIKDEVLFNLGEIYAKLGNTEKSQAAFKKILSDYTDSIYIEVVKERISG
jgi:tetratricopeptide (TPR) repeat protein